jgi:hypothetical protein
MAGASAFDLALLHLSWCGRHMAMQPREVSLAESLDYNQGSDKPWWKPSR